MPGRKDDALDYGQPHINRRTKRVSPGFQRFTAIQGLLFNRWDGLISLLLAASPVGGLDFFSQGLVPLEVVLGFIHSLPGIIKVQFDRKFDRRIFLIELEKNQAIKTEFTLYAFPRLEKDIVVDGVLIDSLQDILVNKVMALTDRMDAKDYADLYLAVQKRPEIKIERLIEAAGKKFGISGVGDIIQGRFLGDIPSPQRLYLTESLSPETLKAFFRNQAKSWIARRLSTEPDL